ncbi:pyridoxamine 5'-phosphate oxidase family protein [Streptomyces sp. CC219B]|uniref:helix-turn-helix domain-containing protein n=1 Tax=Streptomyces sp. CC219B TaxID=3044574 RepID=UPI0024A80F34|nr:pyridoxamine 5'-phosphate oxidase family protein [Streptomyces sp. CC219B]
MTEQVSSTAAESMPMSDLGRRLALRRARLGLTRREVAARAGMASSYLRYLEEQTVAAPGIGALIRLAEALQTTVTELTGGEAERPPGPGRAAPHPEFTELSPAECRALLATHGVGRLAVPTETGPVVVPVNYTVLDDTIVFRTRLGTTPAQASGCQVAFEVDRIDDAFSSGWSVLVRGYARTVTDPDEASRLDERAYSAPWAGGRRALWVRIEPRTVSGRRIAV